MYILHWHVILLPPDSYKLSINVIIVIIINFYV